MLGFNTKTIWEVEKKTLHEKKIVATMLKVTTPWQSDDGHAEKGMIWSQYYKTIRDSEVSQNSARTQYIIGD